MDQRSEGTAPPLTALLVAPDRSLAGRFSVALRGSRAFQVLADLRTYPPPQVLEMRLRQLQPQVTLIDLATDLERASECVRTVAGQGVPVVGLHTHNDSAAILRAVRVGASEFLYDPFEAAVQQQARDRIARLIEPKAGASRDPGKIAVFAAAKPGAGASTLAAHTALALQRGRSRVLLVDLDYIDAAVTFYIGLEPGQSFYELLTGDESLEHWSKFVHTVHGLDVLAAPEFTSVEAVAPARLSEFLERARRLYDWVVLDLPPVFHRLSLMSLAQSDLACVVSTSDLASLHLARKVVGLLGRLGFSGERYRILINRDDGHQGLTPADMARIVNCPVSGFFPNDYFTLERATAAGEPLGADTALGMAIKTFARDLAASPAVRKAT